MKKVMFVLIGVIFIFSTKSMAQYASGNLLLGGTLSFLNTRNYSSFSILPSVGYFLSDHIAVGGTLGFSSSKEVDGLNTFKDRDFYFGPFARFYKSLSEDKKFNFFIQTTLLFDSNKSTVTSSGFKAEGTALVTNLNIGPGFAYYPGKKFGMEIKLNGLTYSKSKNSDSVTSFELSSLSPSLGFTFIL